MNYIKHLTGFFDRVAKDKLLNPTHVSLYMSLFQFWNCNRFRNPISISRDEVMRISKISSKATYHKCLKNLHSLGYINYEPSYNPFKGSHVYLFNFSNILAWQILILQIVSGGIIYILLAKIFKIESFTYLVGTMKQLINSRKGPSAWKKYYY